LERDLAYAAGLGWRAKNTCLIHPRLGSYFFLGEVLTDLELAATGEQPSRCGSCHRCLDACPTRAFVGAGVLDARRCISYLTIELRGAIPHEFRPLIGQMVFGCDICQEVCPWNRRGAFTTEPAFAAREGLHPVDLIRLLRMTQAEFSEWFRGSAIKRAKRRGLARNAAVALGNSGDQSVVPALCEALDHDEPLVRGHAAWALGRLGGDAALLALSERRSNEDDPEVRTEIALATRAIEPRAPGRLNGPPAHQT
ncbi:MAG: tRNA epoxyqueuosine(34) reductase QueG, partial [Chloroflexi bacterium]|nr:tRNA epoxyqueuosine(34) reductase QueG [Chloroflexota bacterium]